MIGTKLAHYEITLHLGSEGWAISTRSRTPSWGAVLPKKENTMSEDNQKKTSEQELTADQLEVAGGVGTGLGPSPQVVTKTPQKVITDANGEPIGH